VNETLSSAGNGRGRDGVFGGRFGTALVTALALLLVGTLVFADFIFGNKVLLYGDIGGDSLNDSYPIFIHLSDYIRAHGIPSWSFYVGMGQNIFYLAGYLILQPVVWLPKELIAQALVFQHLAKVLVAGLLFFWFLQWRGLRLPAALLGSLLLSFSAYMSMGSCWYNFADEVVCFAAVLVAVEKVIKDGSWLFLVLAVAFVGFITAFHFWLCALLLCFYVPARLIERSSWRPPAFFRVCAALAAAALLGVGLSAFVTLPNSYALLSSPRGSGIVPVGRNLFSLPIFQLESAQHYITAALRPFANDMAGTALDFRGWSNYLEAPLSYCGLLCLLLFPQAFVAAKRRERVLYALLLLLLVIPTLFPWFRNLFWLFHCPCYRTFSLFSIFGIITLSMTAFCRYANRQVLNVSLLGVTLLILLSVLFFPLNALQEMINSRLRLLAAILLVAYAALLTLGQLTKRQKIVSWIIVALVMGELTYFNRITVADRTVVTLQELKQPGSGVAYNDVTADVLREIKMKPDSFFRITKTWRSGTSDSLNDAMVFGYYGTSSYSSFNNANYIAFLRGLEAVAPDSEIETEMSPGLLGNSSASTFACEKYVLSPEATPFEAIAGRYKIVKRYGGVYLLENEQFLPFGLSYTRQVDEKNFLQLSKEEKSLALLHSVVLSGKEAAALPDDSGLSLTELREILRSRSLDEVVAERRATALGNLSFDQTRIQGSLQLEKEAVLVFQTPFDSGWRAHVDGKATATFKADLGLLAIAVNPGKHEVELKYFPPFLGRGLIASCISFLILLLSLRRWPRLQFLNSTLDVGRVPHRSWTEAGFLL
jgi:uncharacterized membrane protein YfhO